jgi:acyl-CoA hydrolase
VVTTTTWHGGDRYGIAELHGRTVGERARALIAIAHPDFRDELMARAHQANYL